MKIMPYSYKLLFCVSLLLTTNSVKAIEGFSLIPQGAFTMGNSVAADTDLSDAPTRTVTLDAFYMGKYEVTKAEWDEVRTWGLSNGYTDLAEGGGKASNHPVQSITWYMMVKWCNARSQKEGLTPAYYTNDAQTTIYKTGSVNVTNAQVKWSASGYRLPTEAEWEKAARGGLSGKRFPWGDTISHSQANYYAASGYSYDSSGSVNNYHPTYATGSIPYTSPVGAFAANDYGLYDMAGNVWEWCWDWYGTYAAGSQTNPRGTTSGTYRVIRGGGWYDIAYYGRVAYRYDVGNPAGTDGNIGFRVLRSAVDTDSDGLTDSVETNTGVFVSESNTGTNPNNADTDADGVPDGLEVKEKTSPVDATKFNSFSKGMTAFYPFDGVLNDQSGNNRNGSAQGNHQLKDVGLLLIGDQSLYYSGGGWFKPNPEGLDSSQFSLSVWVSNITSGGIHPEQHVLNIGSLDTPEGLIAFSFGVGGLNFRSLAGNNSYYTDHITHAAKPSSNHLLVTKENMNVRWFLNGTLVRTLQLANDLPVFSTPDFLSINRHWWAAGSGSAARSTGTYSNLRLYNRALSTQEVQSLSQAEKPNSPRFSIINGSYTWHEAKADAEARGGRLAVLDTQEEIDEANAFLNEINHSTNCWIGLTDELSEGQWKWITGNDLSESNWNSGTGEPNNDGYGENYAMMAAEWQWRWNDYQSVAGADISYMLELPSPVLTTQPGAGGNINIARDFDSPTATITATPNPGYIFSGWTGDASGTTNPLTLTMDADKTVGATFAADLSDADADGVTAYDEVTLYQTNPTQADSDGDGLTDGYEIGWFSVVSGSRTWAQAKAHAETQGGTLATFANEDEWNLAMQSIGTDALLDIGGLWIGATDEAVEGTWRWVTGEPFVFTRWETGQPDNLNNSDYAAVAGDLGGTSGKWYDYRAITTRDGYILESGYSTNPSDADSDDDGLLDGAEMTAGTNPFAADTDGDGLTDTQEVNLTHTNPKLADSNSNGTNDALDDQDSDGLGNLVEISTHGTDPRKADTDSDGLSDSEELSYPGRYFTLIEGSFTHAQAAADATSRRGRLASFPNANDFTRAAAKARKTNQGYLWFGLSDAVTEGTWLWSDGSAPTYARWLNGQPDGSSTENHAVLMQNGSQWADAAADFVAVGYLFERVGLDPLDADTDDDGLSDGAEINTHQTNPVLDDSDSDGLADGAEINTHGSNPKLADTDGDGLGDSAEVVTHGTNPAVKDSDADGFDDLFEINTGFDPKQSSSTPDAVSSIRTAVEFRFNAGNGLNYRIESSTDLETWTTVESDIIGTGGVVTRFYSTENQPKRFFRVVKNLNN
jgi:uncharacterized repeat protein (TIGR02543 family)